MARRPPGGIDGKPSSVGPSLAGEAVTIIYLVAAGCPATPPGRVTGRVRPKTRRLFPGPIAGAWKRAGDPPPVLSCTTRGFSCPGARATGGELLPRLFTLTPAVAGQGGLFSVTLSVAAGLGRAAPACSTRHVALRCSDFPLAGCRTSQPPAIISQSGGRLDAEWRMQNAKVQRQKGGTAETGHRFLPSLTSGPSTPTGRTGRSSSRR